MREEMRGLAQGILASHEARATGVASIRRDVSAQRERDRRHIQELGGIRREASRTLRGHLAAGRVELAGDVRHRTSEIRIWLRQVTAGRKAATRQLRDILSREKTGLAQADAHRRSDVRGWMGELTADHSAARKEWQNLARATRTKRDGVAVAEATEEEAVEVGEVTEEFAALSARVLARLGSHAGGTRLSELEREFGLGRLQAARVVRHLMNERKAKKEGLLYFAI